MARRGDKLSEHILWVAKDLFLELGFERVSMDLVAARAETSKRSLYTYYPSKEKLFLGVFELVRGLFLNKLKTPADYSNDPAEATVIFCARYLEILMYERSIQMCRVSVSETTRFPEAGAHYFDALFNEVHARLNTYFMRTYKLTHQAAGEAVDFLLAQLLYPRFTRALFGMDKLAPSFDEEALAKDFDLTPVRKAVKNMTKLFSLNHQT